MPVWYVSMSFHQYPSYRQPHLIRILESFLIIEILAEARSVSLQVGEMIANLLNLLDISLHEFTCKEKDIAS